MTKKVTLSELKNYIISESKKLYNNEVAKDKGSKLKKEFLSLYENVESYVSTQLIDPEELKKIRQNLLKKAAGWQFTELTQVLSEKKVNPWAVCHASTGPEKDDKFEKCVIAVKDKQGLKKESQDEYKEFRFKLKHDKGTITIKTKAKDLETAKKNIAKAEGCPESALTLIKK
jgi:hypothetical protein